MKLTESRIKQIIREEMELVEMQLDPVTLMLGAGGIYALYKMFFGGEPSSNDEALQAVRDHINKKVQDANIMRRPPGPPPQGDLQKQKAKSRLAKFKKQREM